MPVEGVDFSWGRPGGAALVAAKKHFVIRYVPYVGAGGKGLTAAEVADYRAHGLDIVFNFEQTATRMKQGKAAGIADATTSKAAAKTLGFPDTCAVYFSVDWSATVDDYPAIDAYLQGAASVLGASRVGVYGHYRLMAHCHGAGTAAWFWQSLAWSYGALSPYAHLYQYNNGESLNGAAVDYDLALQSNFGQWHGTLPPPSDTTGDNNMVTVTITLFPEGPRHFSVAAGATVKGYRPDQSTPVKVDTFLTVSGAMADGQAAIVQSPDATAIPHGYPFLHVTTGEFAGLYVPQSQVTLGPAPADPTPFDQTDIDAAVAAITPDCTAAIAAAIAALPADTTPFSQADIDAAKLVGVEAEKAAIRSRLGL